MSWFQISEDYDAVPCREVEFPEVGWAPIIDDNGAWGWLFLDPRRTLCVLSSDGFSKILPKGVQVL